MNIADMQTDLAIEARHEKEDQQKAREDTREKTRILQRVEEVTNLMMLTRENVFDIIVEVYNITFADGYEAGKEEEPEPMRNKGWD